MAIAVGAGLRAVGIEPAGDAALAVSVAVLVASLVPHVGSAFVVQHRLGVDVIALVAIAGALALGEYLLGAVIALMNSSGQALETAALRRAREVSALGQRAPTIAYRRRDDGSDVGPRAADTHFRPRGRR